MAPFATVSLAAEYEVLVDDAMRPLPGAPPAGWYYNAIGGDHGLLGSSSTQNGFSQPARGVYRASCIQVLTAGSTNFVGFWQGLNRPIAAHQALRPQAIFHPLIRSAFQGRIVALEADVVQITSSLGRADLTLSFELKGWDANGNEVTRLSYDVPGGRSALLGGPYPQTITVPIASTFNDPVGILAVFLKNTTAGDALDLGPVRLRVALPTLDPKVEPFLFGYTMLLTNYDDASGMVQDRANSLNGDFENITATGKLAKLIAEAIEFGITDRPAGTAAINQIASTLLTKTPRGPGGLWPHFTKNGGTIIAPGSEWASGDTVYALLDLMIALKMVGDPNGYLPACQTMLESIDWAALRRPGNGYSHGYAPDGTPLGGSWVGFGMETIGVNVAALAGGGTLGEMLAPPSDNGSGFILHAGYPIVATGVDRWGNDWSALRQAEIAAQLGWYADPAHANSGLVSRSWFGLSAAERPEGWDADPAAVYQAYGIGGRFTPPLDGNHAVVTPHYSGMVAALAADESLAMWQSLKTAGLVSPLNIVESASVNPQTGAIEYVNFLKGSWNLALFTEGWAMAQPELRAKTEVALWSIPSLTNAWRTLFPSGNRSRLVNMSIRAVAGAADQTLIAGFVISGSGQKQVLVRGIGPSLAQFGVAAPLADPRLSFYSGNTLAATNDNWGGNAGLATLFGQVGAFPLDATAKDAALAVTCVAGTYTAHVVSSGAGGVALAEMYDVSGDARLTNVSARAETSVGDGTVIVGFVVRGVEPITLLLRGVGPSLAQFNVADLLPRPQLRLFDAKGAIVAENLGWADSTADANAWELTGAFPLFSGSADAVLLVSLPPGTYTAHLTGDALAPTGVGLLELYEIR